MRRNLQKTKFQTPKTSNGITLIALVITIIVLLILAGVAINMAIDSDGLFGKANEASEKWNRAVEDEETTLTNLLEMANTVGGTTEEDNVGENDDETSSDMITKWNIAAGDTVMIYLYTPEDNEYNALENNTKVTIDWGDGTVETIDSSNLQYNRYEKGYVTHTYSIANEVTTVKITGECNTIDMGSKTQLTSIEQWGNTGSLFYAFSNCTNLSTIAVPQRNTFSNVTSFEFMFSGCESLSVIPEGLFDNCANVASFDRAFNGCTSLTTIPEELFADCVNATSFYSTFEGCTSLTAIPQILFDNCPNAAEFSYTFSGCTALTGNAIPLWERFELTDDGYYLDGETQTGWCTWCATYSNCTGLANYEEIPNDWK